MGRTTKVVLYDPHGEPYKIVGHRGKVIKFRHPQGFYPRNIAQLYAAIHAGSTYQGGHAVFCHRCGAKTTVEHVASGEAWGWEYDRSRREFTCYTCAQKRDRRACR